MLGLEDNKKVVVVGIPGVGKTSLVTKLVELITEQNKTVGVHSFGTVMLEEAMKNGIKDSIFSEQVMEHSQRQILDLDNNFSFYNFIEGAKEAFKIIVEAYNNRKVEEIKHLVSKEVYNNFQKAVDIKNFLFQLL